MTFNEWVENMERALGFKIGAEAHTIAKAAWEYQEEHKKKEGKPE